MKRPTALQLSAAITVLAGSGQIGRCTLDAGQAATPDTITNTSAQVRINVSTASLSQDEAQTLFFEWVLGNVGPVCFIEPTGLYGRMAAILSLPQEISTSTVLEQRGPVQGFPSNPAPSGTQQRIRIDGGEFIQVTPFVSGDGLAVDMHIEATVRELTEDNKPSLLRIVKTAIIRDGQAIVLGEFESPARSNAPTSKRVRLILIRVLLYDVSGNPLHDWEYRRPATRYYHDATPHFQSEIAPQREPANRERVGLKKMTQSNSLKP